MTLNIGGTGNGKPYCKYNAKADKWFVRGADGEDKEIQRPTFVADLANITTGWTRQVEGQAPERVMDPSIDRMAPSPGEGFRRSFVLKVFSQKFFGGGVEFASASIYVGNAIKELHAQFEAGRSANPGKLPVVQCVGSQPMKDRYGTNYKPTLTIVGWVDPPAELASGTPGDVPPTPPTASLSDPVF